MLLAHALRHNHEHIAYHSYVFMEYGYKLWKFILIVTLSMSFMTLTK